MNRFWILAVMPLLVSCSGKGPPNLPEGVEDCQGSCMVLLHFECPEADSSVEVCTEKCGRVAALPYVWTDARSGPSCIVTSQSIDEVRRCNVKCER